MSTEQNGIVILAFGPQPMEFLGKAAKTCGQAAVICPDAARMAGANFAVGPRPLLDALRKRLEAGSLQAVTSASPGLSANAAQWLANGERGMSSEALFFRLTGMDGSGFDRTAHPYDPDDFRRCRLMLEACPELLIKLQDAADLSPQWAALIDCWATLYETMDAETPNWRSPHGDGQFAHKTYSLIKQAIGRE